MLLAALKPGRALGEQGLCRTCLGRCIRRSNGSPGSHGALRLSLPKALSTQSPVSPARPALLSTSRI